MTQERMWILSLLLVLSLALLLSCNGGGGGDGLVIGGGGGIQQPANLDTDADGINDSLDNCPTIANPDQADSNGDGIGDACAGDRDSDGVTDFSDNCPTVVNPDQLDSDRDGHGDRCDNCPYTANNNQSNQDGDDRGDLCDASPAADLYSWIGNTPLNVPADQGLLASEPAGTTIVSADTSSRAGVVSVNPDGSFRYLANRGFTGTDTFSVTTSNGPKTVTIGIESQAWYVKNDVPVNGDGSLANPFDNLEDAQTFAAEGDTIFLFTGDGLPTNQGSGFTLEPHQKLIGQGVDFEFKGLVIAAAVDPPFPPVLKDTSNPAGIVRLSDNNEVAGLRLEGDSAAPNPGISGSGISGCFIHDNLIVGSPQEGILLVDVLGNGIITGNTINQNVLGNGIDFSTTLFDQADLTISKNLLPNMADGAVRILYDTGALGGRVSVVGNEVTNAGARVPTNPGTSVINPQARGIDVESRGDALVSATVSSNLINKADGAGVRILANAGSLQTALIERNEVTAAGNDGGINLVANDNGRVGARVRDNILSLSPDFDIDVRSGGGTGAASVCLEIAGNASDADITDDFRLENVLTAGDQVQVEGTQAALETGNNGSFVYLPNLNAISFVLEGTCELPP